MQAHIRRALRQPALAWLFMVAAAVSLSWPLLDVVAGNCVIGPIATDIVLECQMQTLVYLFAVWGLMIVALVAIAISNKPDRDRSRKPAEHA